jgi:hypothetical protein
MRERRLEGLKDLIAVRGINGEILNPSYIHCSRSIYGAFKLACTIYSLVEGNVVLILFLGVPWVTNR